MTLSPRWLTAIWLIDHRNFSVIPLEPHGKKPVTKWQAFQAARPSRDNVDAWFMVDPTRNLGIVTGKVSDIVAIDCDSAQAIAWAESHLPHTEMKTITARGQHWFFRHPGSDVSNRAHVRTDDATLELDVRGDHGYVVAPTSVHETGFVYTRLGSWPPTSDLPAFDPTWMTPADRPTDETTPPPPRDEDRAAVLSRAREYVLQVPPAIQGEGGDAHTYRLCCKLVRGFALTDDEALELLGPWNHRCQPPWLDVDLREKVHNARVYGDEPFGKRRDTPPPDPATSQTNTTTRSSAERPWPQPLAEAAYYGLFGRIVRTIQPHTESDPVALLLQLLVMLGNIIGRTAHFLVEADTHYLHEFLLLVGHSSKARKGTSFGHADRLFRSLDPIWTHTSGLSSGEGLIWSVRDPVMRQNKDGALEVDDPGVVDKRLLVFESELASTLHVMERAGNILGDVMKNAWDGRPLTTLTKHSPARATGAHISVIAHITVASSAAT